MTKINFQIRAIALAAAALCFASAASARQAPPPAAPVAVKAPLTVALEKPLWKELSRAQQIALEPLQGEWDNMEGVRKQKWLEIANRYSSMKADGQARVQERMRAWIKLTPEERRLARENYTMSKKLDKNQKSAQWEQYQQLPEEEKRKLAADAAAKKSVIKAPVKPLPATTPPAGNPPVPVPNVK